MAPPTRYVALDVIHRGLADSVQPGEIVPDTIVNMNGEEEPQDFDRLLELGLAEPATSKRQAAAPAADAEPDPAAAAPDGATDADAAPADAPPADAAKKAPAKPRRRSKAAAKPSK